MRTNSRSASPDLSLQEDFAVRVVGPSISKHPPILFTLVWTPAQMNPRLTHPIGHPPNSTVNLTGNRQGGPRASGRTPCLRLTSLEPVMVIDPYREGLEPPCLVCSHKRKGGRPISTGKIVASVTVSEHKHSSGLPLVTCGDSYRSKTYRNDV